MTFPAPPTLASTRVSRSIVQGGRPGVSLISLWVVCLGFGCASAVPAPPPEQPVEETAASEPWPASTTRDQPATTGPGWSQLMKQGRRQLQDGDLGGAEESFVRAYDHTADYRPRDPRTLSTVRNLERVAGGYRSAGDAVGFARVMELLFIVSEQNPEARSIELANLTQELAASLSLQGRSEEAAAALERAAAMILESRGPEDASLVGVYAQMALAKIAVDDLDGAQADVDRAAAIGAEIGGPESPLFARSLVPRARLELARGQTEDARDALEAAVEIHEEHDGELSPETARIVRELASFEQSVGEYAAAEQSFDRVIAIWDALPRESFQRAMSRNELAWFLIETGQAKQAEAPARAALGIAEERGFGGQPLSAICDTLATSLRDQAKYAEAEPLYLQAIDEGTKGSGLPGWDVAEIAERYAVLLEQTGRNDAAADLRARWAAQPKPTANAANATGSQP